MSMGAYDEEEFERREAFISNVEADSDDTRTIPEGRVRYAVDEPIAELLARLEEMKGE